MRFRPAGGGEWGFKTIIPMIVCVNYYTEIPQYQQRFESQIYEVFKTS